jgi:predicted NBD/HSP70 family sugar kinase
LQRKQDQTLDATRVRATHRQLVTRLLWREGRLSRAAIARETGLSRSTVSGIASDLLAAGLISERGAGSSRGGRRPIVLGFDYDARFVVGVDVGATHISVALTDLNATVYAWRSQRHGVRKDPAGTIALVQRLIQDVLREEAVATERCIGVGLAVPSPVHDGNQLSSRLMPAWEQHDLVAELEAGQPFPVLVDNDANLGALSEQRFGAARGRSNVAYIKLATGIGLGLVINGEVYRGAKGLAGEISHTSLDAQGPECICGQRGCLVLLAGSEALIERALERAKDTPRSRLYCRDELSTHELVEAALIGDGPAHETIQQAGAVLGVGLANLINVIDPGMVVLGGDLTRAGRILLDPIREAVAARTRWTNATPTEIVSAQLGDRDIALGAASMVIDRALANDDLMAREAPTSGQGGPDDGAVAARIGALS